MNLELLVSEQYHIVARSAVNTQTRITFLTHRTDRNDYITLVCWGLWPRYLWKGSANAGF